MQNKTIHVAETSVPNQQTFDGSIFPLVLACQSPDATLADVADWIGSNQDELIRQVRRNGAILFRGFPLATPEDFDTFIAAFNYGNFPYDESLSNAVRVNYTPRVFSSNEAPKDINIYLHHEMAQTPMFPSKLFFFCVKAAESGGATPICRSDALLSRIAEECPDFARDCEEKGLKYSNVMPSGNDPESGMGRGWQGTWRAETKEDAEARMQELGYTWEWLPNDCLRATTPKLPGVREVEPGRKTFFNQLIAAFEGWEDSRNEASKAITHGDGTPLDASAVATAVRLAEELTFDVPWQAGDAVFIDNEIAMHGRRTFDGTRKVLASLVDKKNH